MFSPFHRRLQIETLEQRKMLNADLPCSDMSAENPGEPPAGSEVREGAEAEERAASEHREGKEDSQQQAAPTDELIAVLDAVISGELTGAGPEGGAPHALSAGQQHRITPAAALAPAPPLLLCDEVFGDGPSDDELDEIIRQIVERIEPGDWDNADGNVGGDVGDRGGTGGEHGGDVGGDAQDSKDDDTIQPPTLRTVVVETTISLPDGGALLLGGPGNAADPQPGTGGPLLSKLPYVNRLFTNVGIGRQDGLLLLMVTPRIIIQQEAE